MKITSPNLKDLTLRLEYLHQLVEKKGNDGYRPTRSVQLPSKGQATIGEDSFWNQPIQQLLNRLQATTTGLTSSEAQHRLRRYGPNETKESKQPSACLEFLGRFTSPLVVILLFASVISAFTGDIPSFVIVITIVLLSVVLDFVQEMRARDAVDALRQKVGLRATTLRDGQEIVLPVSQLVPGDVVRLIAGDLVPADGRLLDARSLFVNQALLTGESYPVQKDAGDLCEPRATLSEATNAAFAGTSVISGTATLLVCHTGRRTALGEVAGVLSTKPPPTAFETGVLRFGGMLLRISLLLVVFVLTECVMFRRPALESLMFAVALAVGLTPELLPMIVTVTLARGALRLARRRVIVKRLAAIHDLGAIDVLCTDKTGTLTEACIRLVSHIDSSGAKSDRVFELAYLNSCFETGLKSPLDTAILEHRKLDVAGWRKLDELPFDFERRRVSVLVEKDGQQLLIVKGAPEDILRSASYARDETGQLRPLDSDTRTQLASRFEKLGTSGFRALAVATRLVNTDCDSAPVTDEDELSFEGFLAFLDPPKVSADDAVRAMAQSGVAVKILTGDNEQVARHVCHELHIPVLGAVSGHELASMSDEALLARLPQLNLFCRVTPQQKLRVLLALKRSGQVVGFLGDGINDSSALHVADVGISVDSAVDVAKDAADIILLDRDLTVLHDGVLEGRRTVVNVDKYILMASSANFGNIMSTALAGLFLPFLPMLPIQVLLTNLMYDFAQVGLPFDDVDPEAIARPVHWNIRLIEKFMLAIAPISTLFDVITFAVLILVFQAAMLEFRTGWFIESLVTQLLMIFAVRTRRNMFASKPFWLVTTLALTMSLATIWLPFTSVGKWFGFVVPPPSYFGFLAATVVAFLIVTECVKRVFYALTARAKSLSSLKIS